MSVDPFQAYELAFLHFDIVGRYTTIGALRTWFLRHIPGVTAENVDRVTDEFIKEAIQNGRLFLEPDCEADRRADRMIWRIEEA